MLALRRPRDVVRAFAFDGVRDSPETRGVRSRDGEVEDRVVLRPACRNAEREPVTVRRPRGTDCAAREPPRRTATRRRDAKLAAVAHDNCELPIGGAKRPAFGRKLTDLAPVVDDRLRVGVASGANVPAAVAIEDERAIAGDDREPVSVGRRREVRRHPRPARRDANESGAVRVHRVHVPPSVPVAREHDPRRALGGRAVPAAH
jgi:hypothetical protein